MSSLLRACVLAASTACLCSGLWLVPASAAVGQAMSEGLAQARDDIDVQRQDDPDLEAHLAARERARQARLEFPIRRVVLTWLAARQAGDVEQFLRLYPAAYPGTSDAHKRWRQARLAEWPAESRRRVATDAISISHVPDSGSAQAVWAEIDDSRPDKGTGVRTLDLQRIAGHWHVVGEHFAMRGR